MLQRGLKTSDRPGAIKALKRIGYYPLSAYTYPFRLPATPADEASGRERADYFRVGACLEDALQLYNFDRKLRSTLLEALQDVEIALATQVGYVLGKRRPDAHLRLDCLDHDACLAVDKDGITAHNAWLTRFKKLKSNAADEEYVKHHLLNRKEELPVWVATGFMDFGCLIRLFSLMQKRDKERIARQFGLSGNASDTLHRWLRALNILRNHCAHNNRLWNRSTVDVPPKFSERVAPESLHHLNALDNDKRQKIYLLIVLTGHLSSMANPDSVWRWSSMRTVAKKFGNIGGMALENTLGFPVGWEQLPFWNKPQ